ncbi:MAG: cation transporter [Halobacteriales archaeon]|nr:cation transporter [Halobacteriales archaeon]
MDRAALLAASHRLAWITVVWGALEGGFGIAVALSSGSVALLGFGLDALVEVASGSVIVWRSRTELRHPEEHDRVERVERRAGRLVAVLLVGLGLYIGWEAAQALRMGTRPTPTVAGVLLPALSMAMMLWLGQRKRQVAAALQSRAMAGDAFQATACLYLSAIAVGGIALNALFGWWWADPAAALLMLLPIGEEAWKSWRGED